MLLTTFPVLRGSHLYRSLRNRKGTTTNDSVIEMRNSQRSESFSHHSILGRSLPRPPRSDLPKIPSVTDCSDDSNESENYYITTDSGPEKSHVYTDKDIMMIMKTKEDQWQIRWMGTIPASKGSKKCVMLTTIKDQVLRRQDIHWDEFVKRTLDLPSTKCLVEIEGIGVIKAKLHLIQQQVSCRTLECWLNDVFSHEKPGFTMTLSDVMKMIASILDGLSLLHSYGLLHPGLSSKKILRSDTGQCKLYDFCLSKDAVKVVSFKKSKMPYSLNYFPPEALHRNEYSESSDTWSVASIIWEILTDGTTFDNHVEPPKEAEVTHYELIKNKLLYQCWHQIGHQRPTVREIRETYQQIFESLRDDTYEIPRLDLYTSMIANTQNSPKEETYIDNYSIAK